MVRLAGRLAAVAALSLGAGAPCAGAADGAELFETKIRPLLAAKCYACHSENTVASGDLRLDAPEAMRAGGGRGPAVSPGDPEGSLLMRAVLHEEAAPKMPPSGRLEAAEIAALREWIAAGAEFPEPGAAGGPDHWAFQPFKKHEPPEVRNADWARSPIDPFLLAKLEAEGLEPASPADKYTLLRRVTYDLTGLPPTPAEIADFLADDSPQAYEKVVERLLASTAYGERWGRHWLDLARYAETAGHEFDQEKPDAWRYRDYVIRAFNQDLPYDRFVREQIAGDLLARQRLTPDGDVWASPLGTGVWALGEERNAADDLAEVRADKIDNMIDVFGKTFLGLTVACARCHDHKFDPIPTRDYYALAGVFHSSQITSANLDAPAVERRLAEARERATALDGRLQELAAERLRAFAEAFPQYLEAAVARRLDEEAKAPAELDEAGVEALAAAIEAAADSPDHVLYPAAVLADGSKAPFDERVADLAAQLELWVERAKPDSEYRRKRGDRIVDDFDGARYGEQWTVGGAAFGEAPASRAFAGRGLGGATLGGRADSYAGADDFTGILVSKSFRVDRPYLHVRLASLEDETHGRQPGELRVELWSDGRFAHETGDGSGQFGWKSQRLAKQEEQLSFFQIVDRRKDGAIAVDQIVLSDSEEPPAVVGPPSARVIAMLRDGRPDSFAELAEAYRRLFLEALDDPGGEEAAWLAGELSLGRGVEELFAGADEETEDAFEDWQDERDTLLAHLPESAYALVTVEDRSEDLPIFVRGDHTRHGETAARTFLTALGGGEPFERGSGRMELAEAVASADNPLTARVMVNRIWKHHFGEGLVRTVDNFGATGRPPTHPELLDTLAAMFVESGWSVKQVHRWIVLSSAYRMSSEPSEKALRVDGANRLLQHMPIRRLEAEAVRDAVLAVTGTLDSASYGPPVPPHISPFQDGRGKPPSGPLDGEGRRSVYLGVRRNFITPLLLAFDYPLSVTTIGRRTTSTVPSQALSLLNNEFVVAQAGRWADRLLAEQSDARSRIEAMFLAAYGRPVQPTEVEAVQSFLARQAELYGTGPDDRRVWADAAHALINAKEFIFIR